MSGEEALRTGRRRDTAVDLRVPVLDGRGDCRSPEHEGLYHSRLLVIPPLPVNIANSFVSNSILASALENDDELDP